LHGYVGELRRLICNTLSYLLTSVGNSKNGMGIFWALFPRADKSKPPEAGRKWQKTAENYG